MSRRSALLTILPAMLLASVPALAQEAAPAAEAVAEAVAVSPIDSGDTAWMLVSTALVLLMVIPGLALFYGGMVRQMNVLATVMQTFATTCLLGVIWMIAGYSIAFGEGNAFFGDLSRAFLAGVELETPAGTIPESVFISFQMTFFIITPALIAGAFADRMKFSAMLWFFGLWSLIVYAPVCHMVWAANGYMYGDGVLDFAGGTVVHINAGIAGLVAAIVIGKRMGYPNTPLPPHNLVLSVIGAGLLWVGWFGFNAGSAAAANGRAGMAMLVTLIAPAAAGLSWMFVEWAAKGKPSVLGLISGVVGGLVAITPAAGFVAPGGALIIGLVAGAVCFWAATSLKHMLGYDDSLDCFGVHGVGGIVGAVLTGVFAVEAIGGTPGLLEGNGAQLWIQIKSVLITIVYCAVLTFVILKLIDLVIGLRVDKEVEREGLDLALHGEAVH
ncbi:ammonium transporter [Geminicoccus harenae]|uniref:ammonium transporter n=1 Tax=Geminicoccus harenae TaxID=2498453 RepID=UPI00168BA3BB|nr:ammonium transporter [Geminicoccus harenae]